MARQKSKNRKSKKSNPKLDFVIVLATILMSLVLIEILLRVLPEKITKLDYSIVTDNRIFSSTRNIKFKPGNTIVWTGLGAPVVWHYNNLGFRERDVEVNKPGNIFRIVVIGDSVVMGFGVDDYEAFPRRLEQIIKPSKFDPAMTHFEVLNMGIQGYSTREYAAVLREEAVRLKPNLIMIGVYPSNDLSGDVAFERNTTYRRLAALPDTIVPYPVSQFLKEHSRFYLLILNRYYSFIKRYESNYKVTEKDDSEEWAIMERDMIQMRDDARKNGINLLFLSIPNPREVAARKDSITQAKFVELAKKLGVNYYDPFGDLKKYPNIKELYLDDLDDHFSPKGNEYFASLLAQFLWNNKLVPRQPK